MKDSDGAEALEVGGDVTPLPHQVKLTSDDCVHHPSPPPSPPPPSPPPPPPQSYILRYLTQGGGGDRRSICVQWKVKRCPSLAVMFQNNINHHTLYNAQNIHCAIVFKLQIYRILTTTHHRL